MLGGIPEGGGGSLYGRVPAWMAGLGRSVLEGRACRAHPVSMGHRGWTEQGKVIRMVFYIVL